MVGRRPANLRDIRKLQRLVQEALDAAEPLEGRRKGALDASLLNALTVLNRWEESLNLVRGRVGS